MTTKRAVIKKNTQVESDKILSRKLTKIIGAVTLPKNFNEEKVLRSYLEKKHF